jgi:hypothetical protein
MSDEPVDRFAAFAAVFGLLASAAADAPLLVAVDDAHWIDSASLEALGFAARRLTGEAVGMLIAFRDEIAPSFRAASFERSGADRARARRDRHPRRPRGRAAAQPQPASTASRARRTATRSPRSRSPPPSATTGWPAARRRRAAAARAG